VGKRSGRASLLCRRGRLRFADELLWQLDTNCAFETVNGVTANGGSMDAAGPTVAGGLLIVNSGYGGTVSMPGNVLLVFGVE
jgi:polyvinyl alcohol dehydrogenase (cytochrome)